MDNVVGHGFVVEKNDIKVKYLLDGNAFKRCKGKHFTSIVLHPRTQQAWQGKLPFC
jgi:hypothetical protein